MTPRSLPGNASPDETPIDGGPEDPAVPLLQQATRGDAAAARRLLPAVYDELRRVARAYLERERADHTLQPTALVHEAYLRLQGGGRTFFDSAHLLAAAAIAMRRVLVDHARQRQADKRRRDEQLQLDGRADIADPSCREIELLELDLLIERLRRLDPRKARVVELRFFAGMGNEQIAEVLEVARSTVAADWAVARAWLADAMRSRG